MTPPAPVAPRSGAKVQKKVGTRAQSRGSRLDKWSWLGVFCLYALITLMFESVRKWLWFWDFDGIHGTIITGIITGAAFLFFTLSLSRRMESKVEELWNKMHKEVDEEAKERKYASFVRAFTELKESRVVLLGADGQTPIGCYLTLKHHKRSDGTPHIDSQNGREGYVVSVKPLTKELRDVDQQAALYEEHKIKEGECYYCVFDGKQWSLVQEEADDDERKPFRFVGSTGRQYVPANVRAEAAKVDSEKYQLVAEFDYQARQCQLYQAEPEGDHTLWLKIGNSPLKSVVWALPDNGAARDVAKLDVMGLRGYFSRDERTKFLEFLNGVIQSQGVPRPKPLNFWERKFV